MATCVSKGRSLFCGRFITHHWQDLLLMGGALVAVASAAVAFFSGYTLLSAPLLCLGALGIVSIFYMHQVRVIKDLRIEVENIGEERARLTREVNDLSAERARLASAIDTLRGENLSLQRNNQILQKNNADFQKSIKTLREQIDVIRQNNEELKKINADLQKSEQLLQQTNAQLARQVISLSLQVRFLNQSAARIRDEVESFKEGNSQFSGQLKRLGSCITTLDDQISSSERICAKIAEHCDAQQRNIQSQLEQLKIYFETLCEKNALSERIECLSSLNKQIKEAESVFNQTKVEYAAQCARMHGILETLVPVSKKLETAVEALNTSTAQQEQQNLQLREDLQRLTALLNRPLAI